MLEMLGGIIQEVTSRVRLLEINPKAIWITFTLANAVSNILPCSNADGCGSLKFAVAPNVPAIFVPEDYGLVPTYRRSRGRKNKC